MGMGMVYKCSTGFLVLSLGGGLLCFYFVVVLVCQSDFLSPFHCIKKDSSDLADIYMSPGLGIWVRLL